MEDFQKLGDRLEDEWRSRDYDESVFPQLAADGLRAAGLHQKYEPWQVLEWTLDQRELPKQRDLAGRFGEPPITVFSSPRFHIDVYFWFHGTTSTHQHGFCGAFQVMHGSSIHSWYDFDVRDAVNSFCEIGEMRLRSCELLNKGDVQPILPGRQYVHSLFHLDHPSVSIVVRTDKSPLFLPQFDYHKPGLAVDPFYEQEALTKKLQVIGALFSAERPDTDALITRWLESSDFHSSYIILTNVRGHVVSDALKEMFGTGDSRSRFDDLLSVVEKRHPERGDILRKVFEFRERINALVRRRGVVDDPEHRFFFALLLNVDGRERVLSLIRDRFPDSDPIDKILDWTYDLSQMRVAGTVNQTALGIAGFDDIDLQLVEFLLRGRSDGEIADIIRQTYAPEKAEQVLPKLGERTAAIKESIVFAPLLNS
jgi:hypothetical protein